MIANLLVQGSQGLKHVVVQIPSEHEGQNNTAKLGSGTILKRASGCDDSAFHPRKTLPLAALNQQVLFQCAQRDDAGPRVAIWPECQVHPKNKAMFRGLANQSEKGFDGSAEIFLHRNFANALCIA